MHEKTTIEHGFIFNVKFAFLVAMKARGNESGERIRQSRGKFMMRVKQKIQYKSFYVENKEETPLQSKEHIYKEETFHFKN